MELAHLEYPSQSALAERDPQESPAGVALLPALAELERLIESELADETAGAADFLISQDRIDQAVEGLHQVQLSPELARWVDGYGQVGTRQAYLWIWCRRGVELTTLSCVAAEAADEICDTKVLAVMFDVLLDDVADQGGDARLLEQLVEIPFSSKPLNWSGFSRPQANYAAFAESVWNEVRRRVERFSRYHEFAELFRYDYRQLLNTMRYAHLLNRFPSLMNVAEHDLYLPHNMHMMISATMDLMCSPGFDFGEIGRLREAMSHAQRMGRIGNLITTWERELDEQDFTSGVFAHALIHGQLSLKQLATADREFVVRSIRQGGHEQYFLDQWQDHRRQMMDLRTSLHTVALEPLIGGLEQLICLHLASRGLK